jgi:hypothetical protein
MIARRGDGRSRPILGPRGIRASVHVTETRRTHAGNLLKELRVSASPRQELIKGGFLKSLFRWLAAGLLAGSLAGAAAAETGTLRSAADLRAAPYSDAKLLGRLDSGARVTVAERRGAWLRVTAAEKRAGWVRLHQVRLGDGSGGASGAEGLGMLRSVAETGRSGSHGIVATTGVRGLSAEDLKNAKPNPQALATLEQYRATPEAARQQARSAGLKESDVAFLPNP